MSNQTKYMPLMPVIVQFCSYIGGLLEVFYSISIPNTILYMLGKIVFSMNYFQMNQIRILQYPTGNTLLLPFSVLWYLPLYRIHRGHFLSILFSTECSRFKPCTDASNWLVIGHSNCLRWLATEVSTCWIFYLQSFDIFVIQFSNGLHF